MLKMNPEVKALWLDALRSGEYKQGRTQLAYKIENLGETRHCCLGVLCDLAVKAGKAEVGEGPDYCKPGETSFFYGSRHGDLREIAYLPDSVIEWAGLDSHIPIVETETGQASLPSLNDGMTASNGDVLVANKSFTEIADLIEASL